MNLPREVSPAEWEAARARLLVKEKAATPLGRQEDWEWTPAGRPQSESYTWWRLHDDDRKEPA